MSVLSAFSTVELEAELAYRRRGKLEEKVKAINAAIAEAEAVARGLGLGFQVEIGSAFTLVFDLDSDDWFLD